MGSNDPATPGEQTAVRLDPPYDLSDTLRAVVTASECVAVRCDYAHLGAHFHVTDDFVMTYSYWAGARFAIEEMRRHRASHNGSPSGVDGG